MTEDDEASSRRIHRLFMQKLEALYPGHPWVLKERSMKWQEPRRVAEWWWMEIGEYKEGCLLRGGKVSWNQDGTGYYSVDIHIDRYGFPCWPQFRALSDAQDFVDHLMTLPLEEVKALNGTRMNEVL